MRLRSVSLVGLSGSFAGGRVARVGAARYWIGAAPAGARRRWVPTASTPPDPTP